MLKVSKIIILGIILLIFIIEELLIKLNVLDLVYLLILIKYKYKAS